MTKELLTELLHCVKRSHWSAVDGVRMFHKRHPEIELTPEHYGYAVGVGRTVFPNIKGLPEGPFPVYKDRPFYDARLWDTEEQRVWEAELARL